MCGASRHARRATDDRNPTGAGVCYPAMAARQAILEAATSYLRSHPDEVLRALRNALGLRVGVPIAGLRYLAGRAGESGPQDVEIDPDPPGIRMAATLEMMGTTVRATTSIFIERIRISAEEARLELRLEGTNLRVVGDAETPVAALIRSGALDLTKSGSLAANMPRLGALLGESSGNRLVIDLMKHPKIGRNKALRRALGLVTSVLTVQGVQSDDGHVDVVLRAFPRGVGGAVRAVRDHLFTDGPPWIRGMLPGRRGDARPGW